MDEQRLVGLGGRLRQARKARRQTQAVVAGLAGITTDYLYQIERGRKLPTLAVLLRLADVLRMPIGALLGDEPTAGAGSIRRAAGDALARALTQPPTDHQPVILPDLAVRIADAWHTWQTSPRRYSKLVAQLPSLIADVSAAERQDDVPRRIVSGHAADLYVLLRTVTKRIGRVDLSLLVADRALRAAEDADDPHRLAVARWNMAQVLLAEGQNEGAEAVAVHGVDALADLRAADDLDAIALTGSLTLLAAVASARHGDSWTARERVQSTAPLAALTGERNVGWTVFGPTNVAMYAVSVEVEAGESAEALRLAERVGYTASPSIERRVAFLLEQAKGFALRQDYGSSLLVLQTASREAPEDIAYRPSARSLLTTLVDRGRGPVANEAARLATAAGIAVG